MTPRRTHPGGPFRFDRSFPGVGNINRSSRTKSLKTFHRLNDLLTELWEDARVDVLRDIRSGRVTAQEVYDQRRKRKPYDGTSVILARRLEDEVARWVPRSAEAERSRKRYRVSWDHLLRLLRSGAKRWGWVRLPPAPFPQTEKHIMSERSEAVGWWGVGVALLLGTALLFAAMRPLFMDLDREAVTHSRQYVESARAELVTLAQQARATENDGQRRAILNQMEETASRIPEGEVPDVAAAVLREAGR